MNLSGGDTIRHDLSMDFHIYSINSDAHKRWVQKPRSSFSNNNSLTHQHILNVMSGEEDIYSSTRNLNLMNTATNFDILTSNSCVAVAVGKDSNDSIAPSTNLSSTSRLLCMFFIRPIACSQLRSL